MYTIQKNITRFYNLHSTYFLDPKELKDVCGKIKKGEYQVYSPYKDSEKRIVYSGEIPEVFLYEIKCNTSIRHQDILGSLYSLNIDSGLFGDIIIINNHYYVYLLPIICNYFEANFTKVRNSSVQVSRVDLSFLENYERSYESLEYIVSSTRIDTVISTICHCNRGEINHMISKKDIILNYELLKNSSYKLRDGDIFSIRRIGKFCFRGIERTSKKGHFIITVLKYL